MHESVRGHAYHQGQLKLASHKLLPANTTYTLATTPNNMARELAQMAVINKSLLLL